MKDNLIFKHFEALPESANLITPHLKSSKISVNLFTFIRRENSVKIAYFQALSNSTTLEINKQSYILDKSIFLFFKALKQPTMEL
jgi:hypothetical protein